MTVAVKLELVLNEPFDEIGEERLKEGIEALLSGGGNETDDLYGLIGMVQVRSIAPSSNVVPQVAGGKARAKKLSADQRQAIARKAALKRWQNERDEKKRRLRVRIKERKGV